LADLGYRVGGQEDSPIIPVHVGDDWQAASLWRNLLDHGVYTNCAVAPAVPAGRALLRMSVMATHTSRQIADALSAFEAVRSTFAGQPFQP
jgi:8-amino-7-oxononanoate synthase